MVQLLQLNQISWAQPHIILHNERIRVNNISKEMKETNYLIKKKKKKKKRIVEREECKSIETERSSKTRKVPRKILTVWRATLQMLEKYHFVRLYVLERSSGLTMISKERDWLITIPWWQWCSSSRRCFVESGIRNSWRKKKEKGTSEGGNERVKWKKRQIRRPRVFLV